MAENQNNNRTRIPVRRPAPKEPTRSAPKSRDELRRERYLERRRKRKRNLIIGYSAAAVAVVIVAVVLSLTVFFKISSFEVGGDEIYSPDEIIAASELKNGENLFAFDKQEVADLVETKLPYVGELAIKRSPTGKITFTVTVAKAVMAIDNGDSYTLLDASCKVLETETQSINEDVAIIVTSPVTRAEAGYIAEFENTEDVANLTRLAEIISVSELEKITQYDVTDINNLTLKYDMRITLKVGMLASLESKTDFIKATLKKLDGEEPAFKGTIDFTIDNKAFVNDIDEQATTLPAPAEPETEAPEQGESGETTTVAENHT